MHTFGEAAAGVPAFLAKLWRLVEDPDTNNLICWSKDGRSFIIQNQAQFARELLPLNYKHNNMASFIRQLNMYGFHKITSIENGGLKFDRDEMEFSHPCFKRNCPYLLEHIKRKIANTKAIDEKAALKPEAVTKVLQDVKSMRSRQDTMDSRFSVMKQENEALWREIASLRQKHAKQQQIVNKLIQFLITIVQPTRNLSTVKRNMQLMINDRPENGKLRQNSESDTSDFNYGPVIHELREELLDEVADQELDTVDLDSPYSQMHEGSPSPYHTKRPHSSISQNSHNFDYSNQSAEDLLAAAAAACTKNEKNNSGSGTATGNADLANNRDFSSSIIQSVNPDGTKIVYHVTEVPDMQPTEASASLHNEYNEDNVLTTPMVRQEMARSQMLKHRNKQRRGRSDKAATLAAPTAIMPQTQLSATIAEENAASSAPSAAKIRRGRKELNRAAATASANMLIKDEQDVDPMVFLNICPDSGGGALGNANLSMISPNMSEDSRQSSVNSSGLGFAISNVSSLAGADSTQASTATTPTNEEDINRGKPDIYSPNQFMPSEIFEESLMEAEGSNMGGQFQPIFSDQTEEQLLLQQKQLQKELQQEKEQFSRNSIKGGKFAAFLADNAGKLASTNNGNGASTSAAAAAASGATSPGKNGGNNLALAKLNKNNGSSNSASPNMELMRLSTAEDVHGHLENVQEELDALKDILGTNGCFDASTLMGSGLNGINRVSLTPGVDADFFNKLFNESDILGNYNLQLSNDGSGEKKGNELMAYQPIYDLTDIMDMNDKELEEASATGLPPTPRHPSSMPDLNTPYHE